MSTSSATASPLPQDRFLGMKITPITRRRLHNFKANRRGFWSLWIFLILFTRQPVRRVHRQRQAPPGPLRR